MRGADRICVNRREVLDWVVRELRIHAGCHDDKRRNAQHERVAIGRHFYGDTHPHRAAAARAVVDYHLLTPRFTQFRRDGPRDEIAGASRQHGCQPPDGLGRIDIRRP